APGTAQVDVLLPDGGRLLELRWRRHVRLPDQPADRELFRGRHPAHAKPRPRRVDGRVRHAGHCADGLCAAPDRRRQDLGRHGEIRQVRVLGHQHRPGHDGGDEPVPERRAADLGRDAARLLARAQHRVHGHHALARDRVAATARRPGVHHLRRDPAGDRLDQGLAGSPRRGTYRRAMTQAAAAAARQALPTPSPRRARRARLARWPAWLGIGAMALCWCGVAPARDSSLECNAPTTLTPFGHDGRIGAKWNAATATVAYGRTGANGYYHTFVSNADGSNERRVDWHAWRDDRHQFPAAWHPSGHYLVMTVEKNEHERSSMDATPGYGAY